MSERNQSLTAPSTEIAAPLEVEMIAEPAVSVLGGSLQAMPSPALAVTEEEARARIAALEREVKALGTDPSAALLFHEIGLLWEDPLKNARNAAVAFQNAFRLAPRFLSNIRAARRLFADVGNWQMVVQLLDAELAACDDASQRAALLVEKGAILEGRLSRDEDAAATFRECLELKPKDVSLLIQLEGVYAAKQDDARLVEVQRLLADALDDPTLKARYLTSAGAILEYRMKEPDAAAVAYRTAFSLDRSDILLLGAMKRVAERDGKTDELLAALSAEAELLGPAAVPTYLQISKVHEKLGHAEEALAALLAARHASSEPLVLAELARIYEAQQRWEDLADVLLSWVDGINDESELVAINLRLAALYEEILKRDEDAIGRYSAILAKVPKHAQALAGLGKLYHRTQSWEGLVSIFELESQAADDPKQKAARLYKAAEVLAHQLGRTEKAIARYNQCLQLQPGYLPAQKALTHLFEGQGRFSELVAILEQDLLQTTDRDQIIITLNKIASICEDRLSDLDHAIDCMTRILDLTPEHVGTMHNLARLYEAAGKWRELITLHEREATLVGDTKQVLSLHHRNAEILEEQLQDRAGAIAAYERLLALSPAYLPGLRALGRLYAQDGRWDDLVKMYRAESEISSSPEAAAALIHKIGELQENRLKSEPDAIASYQEVLTLAPSYFPALRALARIYRGQGAWESLIEVLRAEAANRTDPVERANAIFRAAGIWEDHLGRPEMAIAEYQECLRLNPGHTNAIRALERLYTSRGDTKQLVAILDHEAQTAASSWAKVTAYLKLSHLYLDTLNEPARAAQCCETVLDLDPACIEALSSLERIRAADPPRRAEIRARLAEQIRDPRLRMALRLAAAGDAERASAQSLVEELSHAHRDDPSDVRLGLALESALRQAGDFRGLVALYEERISHAQDAGTRLELALRVADLCESKTGDLRRAAHYYAQAMELSPSLIPALHGARRVFVKLGDWANARTVLEAEGRASRDVRAALEAFVAAGKAAEKLNDAEGAIANYRRALERDPLDPAASAGLEELLAKSGGAADLAAMHERRGEAKLAQRDLPAAAGEFFAAAQTWLEKMGDLAKGMAALERTLAAQPGHIEALEMKAKLCLGNRQYAEAAAALAARVQQGGDGQGLAAVHLQLGALYQEHLGDVNRAAAHLQTALASDPANAEALRRLADIHTASRNWSGAADCLKRLIEAAREPQQLARHTLALARIVDEGFGDAAQASALYRRALEMAPGDASIIDRLVALYEKTSNLPELVQMLEQQAGQAQQAGDPARSVALRLKVGDLYARQMQNPTKGIAVFRQVVEQDPYNVSAHVSLADLYMRDAAAGPLAVQEHLHVVRLDPAKVDSLHALFRLWDGLRQADKAFCATGVLHFLKATNEVEIAAYNEARNRIPSERPDRLQQADLDVLMHPAARTALTEVLRAVGDQLSRIYPPNLEALGIDRKQDRVKPDHAVFKAIRSVAQVLGVEELEVYTARRGLVTLETGEPLAICVGPDVIRRFNAREQKFLFGRAVMGLVNRTALVSKLSTGELADLLGNSIRIHQPGFNGLGRRNEESIKNLRKTLSRKALKALEAPAAAIAGTPVLDVKDFAQALQYSSDRAGMILCGDVMVGLQMVLRDDPNFSTAKPEATDALLQSVQKRDDLRAMINFALSEECFRLRAKLGVTLP